MESKSARNAVLMLKSTYYPELRRRILTLLSLPKDAIYEVEYESKWIDDELNKQLENDASVLNNKDAYVAFWDYGRPQFYPIRLCKIQAVQSGEPYKFILKMGNLLAFEGTQTDLTFSNLLSVSLKSKGFATESNTSFGISKLVISFDDASVIGSLGEVQGDDDKEWQRIVQYLVEVKPIDSTSQFTESLFLKLRVLDEEHLDQVKIKDGRFELTAHKGYLFRLRAFQPHWKNFDPNKSAKILFGFDEKVLRHIGARLLRMPLSQRTYNKDFKITTNAPIFGAKSSLIFERETDEFNAASYDVPISVPVQYGTILLKFVPFPVGLLFVGLASDIAQILVSWGVSLPSIAITLAITLLGTLLCAISLRQVS